MIILASQSSIRRQLLHDAGVPHQALASGVDEEKLAKTLAPVSPTDLAMALAKAKALAVSQAHPTALVIAADQTCEFDGILEERPKDLTEARAQLGKMRGKTHYLHSAVCSVRHNDLLWQHIETVALTMRPFSDSFLEQYLGTLDPAALLSSGSYQIEKQGVQLFEHWSGSYHAILGLPLLPLLAHLRQQNELDT